MTTYARYAKYQIDEKLLKVFIENNNPLALLFQWTKQGIVSFKDFESFIQIHKEEQDYQVSLDTYD